jgi:hypothetical protein
MPPKLAALSTVKAQTSLLNVVMTFPPVCSSGIDCTLNGLPAQQLVVRQSG